jgi:hypothetical protein
MAAGNTYTQIASTTLGTTASSVTFSSIPGTYTDLVLVLNLFTSASTCNLVINVNGDAGSNYSVTFLSGTGGSAQSSRSSNQTSMNFVWTSASLNNTSASAIINFQNYSNTTTNKTVLGRYNVPNNEVTQTVNLWRNTAAISSMEIKTNSNVYAAGSTFNLYGIASA